MDFKRPLWLQRTGIATPSSSPAEIGLTCPDLARVTDGLPAQAVLRLVGVLSARGETPEPTASFRGSGADVAASALVRALARYGSIPKVNIFAPLNRIDACRQLFSQTAPETDDGESKTLQFFSDSDLRTQFQTQSYDVLHDTALDLTRSSYTRSRFSPRIFPITCSQYGISYSFQLHSRLIPMLTAPIYPCDAIVCSTHASRRAMQSRLASIAERYGQVWGRTTQLLPRLELIPWGVDAQQLRPRDKVAARRDLDLPLDRPILLCIARVQIQDKMDWTPLLLVFDRVRRMVKERPLLVLAGADVFGYSECILAQASELGLADSIRTFFNFPSVCLASLYAACDVFVSPTDSPSESFGLTIAEAMACGRPVVASDWDGYKELIVHNETGFKVRSDWADCFGELNEMAPLLPSDQQHLHVGQSVNIDVAEMAYYLTLLLNNPDLREDMGARARARVEALYDWPSVVGQWEALWGELAGVARSIKHKEPDRLDYLKPDYFEHFSHYASRIIDQSIPVHLTPRGKEVIARKLSLFLHPWARGFLDPQCLHATLAALKPAQRVGTCFRVGDVLQVLGKTHRLSRDRALMHLMWLAKYDLISFGGAPSGARDPAAVSADQACSGV